MKKNYAIWPPFTDLSQLEDRITIAKARGEFLYTTEGKEIIDAISSWWVNLHGHSNEEIATAIALQATALEHVIFAGFSHQPAEDFCAQLVAVLPEGLNRFFFSDNGSTAIEVAIKLTIQYWENKGMPSKAKILALEGAYHGDTFGAMSVGARSIFSEPFESRLFEVVFTKPPICGNINELLTTKEVNALAELKESILSQNIGVFIFEPLVQGASGMRFYKKQWLDELLDFCKAEGIITIADEVFTGFGRTEELFVSTTLSTKPNMIALSKGITGGFLPLGLTVCDAEVQSVFYNQPLQRNFLHGHSYTANPLACAAAIKSLTLLLTERCFAQRMHINVRHQAFANELKDKFPNVNTRSFGTILALDFPSDQEGNYLNELRNELYPFFISNGVLLRPLGNVVYVVPPYCISEQSLHKVYTVIELALKQVLKFA